MSVQAMAPAPALNMPPASSPDEVLVVRMGTSEPYINEVATRVAYDGMDNVFIIHYRRADGKEGEVHVPHWLFTDEQVITDVLEYARAGVSVPARYTPYMVPRLWPYMRDARAKWAREFDEMAHASTGMLATATVLTLRPLTAPAIAPAVAPAIAAAQTRAGQPQAQRAATSGAAPVPAFSQTSIESAVAQMARPASAQISVGARALAKKLGHAQAGGYRSAFEGIAPTTENAQTVVRQILSNPSRTVWGKQSYDVFDALGRGVRFDMQGIFKGFIEASRATR